MFFPKYYRMSCDIIIRSMSCCCCCYITLVVSNSVRPHRRQPTRIPRPWDCPGKNTGAGCHFLLQCRKVKGSRSVVSDSSRPHGLQPTRLLHPWDFPGKSAGVGCLCLLLFFYLVNFGGCYYFYSVCALFGLPRRR